MPKTQKTTKKTTKNCKKTCKIQKCPETHSLKNLIILWLCILAAGLLGVYGFTFVVSITKENARVSAASYIEERKEKGTLVYLCDENPDSTSEESCNQPL